MGEIQLLKPALYNLDSKGSIILVNPPYVPSSLCLQYWFSNRQRILWVKADTVRNTLWATEKILQHNTCAALLCWIPKAHPASIHRLHLAARQSHTLFFSLRPASAATQSSIAPLRLSLEPGIQGLNIHVLKRRGPLLKKAIPLRLHRPETGLSLMPDSSHQPRPKEKQAAPPLFDAAQTIRAYV